MSVIRWLSHQKITSLARWFGHPGRSILHGYIRFAGKQRIMAGPFKGMLFRPDNWHVLLGTYELEIYPAFDRLFEETFDQIVNVGAEYGFYSVGFALRYPDAQIIAFEKEEFAQNLIRENAAINHVTRQIQIEGLCSIPSLSSVLSENCKSLLIVDVEGFEKELLNPAAIPALKDAAMLVETHDFEVPNCTSSLLSAFCETHEIHKYSSRPRRIEDYPLKRLPLFPLRRAAVEVMTEGRPAPQDWLLMLPKTH